MLVSIVISALNEERYLPNLFEDLKNQTYSKEKIEVLLINAMSTDRTRVLMEQFRDNNTSFKSIRVLDNPKKNQASGFNLGVLNSLGDCILKIDAHATIPKDFVEKNVINIKNGEYVCGGVRPTLVESNDNFSKTLYLVEENMFGSSIANYRKSKTAVYVKSIFHGMYKREVFDTVGLVDERLGRTEDNEFHYRLREYGYKIYFDPKVISYQYIRPTLSKMLKQKYSNGFWIGLTSHVKPKCLSIFHFVPFVFVLGIFFSLAILPITKFFALSLALLYGLFTILVTVVTIASNKFNCTLLLMPFLLFSIHFAYGLGTLVGVLKGFSWKKEYFKS